MFFLERFSLRKIELGWCLGLAIISIILVLPLLFNVTHYPNYLLYIAVKMMILGLYAMSFDLLLGITGIFSFGHSACFGTGAYILAILATRWGVNDPMIGIFVALLGTVIFSGIVGFLATRVGALAIFLVTFASTEVMGLVTLSNPLGLTNGENGLAGIKRLPLMGIINIEPEVNFYYFAFLVLLFSYLILRKVVHSPLGDIFQAIRENAERVRYLGYNVKQFQIISFMIAGLFGGLAGSLNALHERVAGPDCFSWAFAGDAVLYAVLGGPGTLLGPMLGASIIVFLGEIMSDIMDQWVVLIGLSYMILILFLPKGLYPLISKKVRWLHRPSNIESG